MSELAAQSVTLRRTSTILIVSFATLALILAAVGLYGVMSYAVVHRSHEIGIRMALGAERSDVLRMVVRNGLRMVLIGELVGMAGALLLARAVSSLVYGVSPSDPRALIASMGLLTLVALTASGPGCGEAGGAEPDRRNDPSGKSVCIVCISRIFGGRGKCLM